LFSLATELHMTVQQLGRAMDSKEFSEWMIFYKIKNEDSQGSKTKANKPAALNDALMGMSGRGKK
jgi:hypothetical protein